MKISKTSKDCEKSRETICIAIFLIENIFILFVHITYINIIFLVFVKKLSICLLTRSNNQFQTINPESFFTRKTNNIAINNNILFSSVALSYNPTSRTILHVVRSYMSYNRTTIKQNSDFLKDSAKKKSGKWKKEPTILLIFEP